MDAFSVIAKLCGPADYRVAPRTPKPTSGLVEQQRWFALARKWLHDPGDRVGP
jgi:hypothetical protein